MPFNVAGGNIAKLAYDNADTAIQTANEAKSTADQTRTEFNQITNNDTSALGGQLSVGADGTTYSDAQERFVQEHNSVSSLLAESMNQNFNVEAFRISSDAQALNDALAAIPKNSIIKFDSNKTYTLQAIPKITKAVTIDFNGATVLPDTTGDLFTIGLTGETEGKVRIFNFKIANKVGVVPNTIFKIDGAINTEIDGTFSGVQVAHSLVWNYKGYGTKIRGQMRRNTAPRCIYLSNNGADIFSFMFDINVDITGNSAKGIEIEGGNGKIGGIIEGCTTGIHYNAINFISALNIEAYFEANTVQSILLDDTTGSQATIFLNSSFFNTGTGGSNKAITLGRRIYITSIGNFFNHCGIFETSAGVSAASWYNGTNNSFISGGDSTFSINSCELSDGIFDTISKTLTYGNSTNKIQSTSAGLIPLVNNAKTLGSKMNNFSDIWAGNLIQLPALATTGRPTPTRGGAVIFDATLGVPVYWSGSNWKRFDTNAVV